MGRFPKVRALCQRVRRPTIALLTGMGMIAPLGAFAAYESSEQQAVAQAVRVDRVKQAEAQALDAVATAWRERVLDRERLRASAQYAARFRIPLGLADDIHWAARRERIDPSLAFRLVRVESSFQPHAESTMGALGLTQVKPSTANWLFPGTTREALMDPRFNARVGFRYLRRLLDTYGDANLALLAYNRGPARVDSLISVGEDPDNGYSEAVLTGDRSSHTAYFAARRQAAEAAKRRATS